MRSLTTVALGGHAILRKKEKPSIERQFTHTQEAMQQILGLITPESGLVITHGNGPQVGNILMRSEIAERSAYPIPLSVAVAESEGEIGYVIQQSLYNALIENQQFKPIVTILTQVLVDRYDPAFENPTKPIGPFFTDDEAMLMRNEGTLLKNFPGYGWRRIVASPIPIKIIENDTIRRLVNEDVIVIAAGGGGIPVYQEEGRLRGIDAVIDKDLASSVLAQGIGADCLLLLTDVNKVYLDYGKSGQTELNTVSVFQAIQHMAEGHFPPGSMGPKMQGAIEFVRATGYRALITSPETLQEALKGRDGTWVVP